MKLSDIELNLVVQDLQYGRDFVITADETHPNKERWLGLTKISTGQLYTMQPEQLLRDFEVKQPAYE